MAFCTAFQYYGILYSISVLQHFVQYFSITAFWTAVQYYGILDSISTIQNFGQYFNIMVFWTVFQYCSILESFNIMAFLLENLNGEHKIYTPTGR
jgi:hypothetical protein